MADTNPQKHRTRFQTRVTSVESESPNITLTKNLRPGSQVDDKGKLLSPKGEKPIKLKAIKIKVHLRNEKDRQLLNKTFGCVRWTCNECVKAVNTKSEEREQEINPKKDKPLTWQQYLRKHVLHSKSETLKKNPWLKETGYNIRDDAQKCLMTAFDTNVAKVKKGVIKCFKLYFQ